MEIDANWSLITAGASVSTSPSATPRHLMEQAISEKLVFIAVDELDQPLGFLAGLERDGGLYIGEIDVWREWQGKGIGSALIRHALHIGRERGLWGAMLSTDRYAPFNMPFYEKLGFFEISVTEAPTALSAVIHDELDRGHNPARRVAMIHRFSVEG
ncbi:GNAT family N-acetyltransferase [Paracoccus liaowanqingii]|uniref:GNAT family N-acetyltransferase n=1 Tax=Paracoccus liaowanqingii TaxID=2560053 RepID=UPI00159BAC41|nr:GNAT family N-acetyltransferase [Paracoccus liaowanqingii]